MSESEDVEVVKRAYAALAKGDIPESVQMFAPDAEWEYPPVKGIQYSGPRRGREDMRRFFALAAALALCAVIGCSTLDKSAPDTVSVDRAAIAQREDQHKDALARKDMDGILAVYSADVVMMPPNEPPIRGKEALRSWFAKLFSQVTLQPGSRALDSLELAGDLAVERLLFSDSAGQATGKAIHVYRRQADGTWRITQDIWNRDVPATPTK